MSTPESLRHALNQLDALPAIPVIAQKILSLKITTEEGERALLKLIERDPVILSRIIGLSNSALFGAGREILTLKDAATLLGSKRVKMVALSFAMMSAMTAKTGGLLNIQNLWKHSLAVAMTMDTLAGLMPQERSPAKDEIYLAGLLHDIGFLVLDYIDTPLSDQFHMRLAVEAGLSMEEIESEMLELSHGELGAALGWHWGLPESIIAVLNYHHKPHDPRAEIGQPLVRMANLAEKLLPTFGIQESVQPEVTVDEWLALGVDPDQQDEIAAAVAKNIHEVSFVFG